MNARRYAIRAVTLDFYNTLAFHRAGPGRGRMLMRWLADRGLESAPWEHEVLYDVFERHGRDYRPGLTGAARQRFLEQFSETLFDRLDVDAPADVARKHAAELWQLLGPTCLALFPDVESVLGGLKASGVQLAIVSNWQRGLGGFAAELGLGHLVEHVIASADVGHAKPDPEIFTEACRRLGVEFGQVLHVGDTVLDDVRGALGAGMRAALVRRQPTANEPDLPDGTPILDDLGGVLSLIAAQTGARRGPRGAP
jgi:putative hydrolase of the HAD superfamily